MVKFVFLGLLLMTVLVGCTEETSSKDKWDVSPTFEVPVNFGDGSQGEYIFIGEEEKLGILLGSGKEGEAEAQPIIAEQGNKYMWRFVGEKEQYGKLKVVGKNEKGEEHKILVNNAGTSSSEKVWEYPEVMISPNDVDGSLVPSFLEFPTPGLWKLIVYIDNQPFGEFVVDVLEKSKEN